MIGEMATTTPSEIASNPRSWRATRVTASQMGIAAGVLAVVAGAFFEVRPPEAYGICMACHGRDLVNWTINAFAHTHLEVAPASLVYPVLTTIGALQSLSAGSVVNFRVTPYGAGGAGGCAGAGCRGETPCTGTCAAPRGDGSGGGTASNRKGIRTRASKGCPSRSAGLNFHRRTAATAAASSAGLADCATDTSRAVPSAPTVTSSTTVAA